MAADFIDCRARIVSDSAVKSAIENPAIFTARLSGRSRRSWHVVAGNRRHILREPFAVTVRLAIPPDCFPEME